MITSIPGLNGWTILKIGPESVDSGNVSKFKTALASHISPAVHLILDLGNVEFMDSSALGALLTATRAVEHGGGALRLAALTPPVRTLFELVRLHRVFEIMNDCEEAAA